MSSFTTAEVYIWAVEAAVKRRVLIGSWNVAFYAVLMYWFSANVARNCYDLKVDLLTLTLTLLLCYGSMWPIFKYRKHTKGQFMVSWWTARNGKQWNVVCICRLHARPQLLVDVEHGNHETRWQNRHHADPRVPSWPHRCRKHELAFTLRSSCGE